MTKAPANEAFFSPQTEGAPERKKPGPKPKSGLQALASVPLDPKSDGVTADAGISPHIDERKTLAADVARIRAMRKPFGTMTQKLALPARSGYHRHWFSDEPGRVDEAKSNGWAHVLDKEGKPVKRVVGRGRDSGALYGYAMELPQVFWEEDMAHRHDAAQARIDEIKKAPFRAKPGQSKTSDTDKFYSPREEGVVQMSESVVRSQRPGS